MTFQKITWYNIHCNLVPATTNLVKVKGVGKSTHTETAEKPADKEPLKC